MPIGQDNPVAWRRQMAGLFVIFAAVFILFRVLFGLSVISGPSMQDTLSDGDLVFFRRIAYTPEHGDIVLVNCENRREVLVKRVIGLPGDVIEIDEKTASVYRNGKLLEEDYISTPTSSRANMTGPVTVREDCIFVMGDNRENSGDSRYDDIGQIPYEDILGKYVRTIMHSGYFGHLLDQLQ